MRRDTQVAQQRQKRQNMPYMCQNKRNTFFVLIVTIAYGVRVFPLIPM